MPGQVYADPADVAFAPADVPKRPRHGTALLVDPAHFALQYRINPHMEADGSVDRTRAREQWTEIRAAYERYADAVRVLDPDAIWEDHLDGGARPETLPDLVFAANQSLPYPDRERVVLSRMATPERRAEVPYFDAWYRANGYETERLTSRNSLEGMGDALWVPGRRLLVGGYGVRSDRAAYAELADRFDAPVVLLELSDPTCYHLDVCLSPLDDRTALVYPDAFTDAGLAKLDALFEHRIEVPRAEAVEGFACNAHCVDGEHVLLQRGNETTCRKLRDHGFAPVELPTGEFTRAGGSVFCLKLMLP